MERQNIYAHNIDKDVSESCEQNNKGTIAQELKPIPNSSQLEILCILVEHELSRSKPSNVIIWGVIFGQPVRM